MPLTALEDSVMLTQPEGNVISGWHAAYYQISLPRALFNID